MGALPRPAAADRGGDASGAGLREDDGAFGEFAANSRRIRGEFAGHGNPSPEWGGGVRISNGPGEKGT